MTTINPGGLRPSLDMRDGNIAAIFLALLGVGLASALIPFIPQNPLGLAASVAFPVAFFVALGLPSLQCLPLIPRMILTLLALRPLMDAVQSSHESSSSFSLQTAHAALIVALLIIAWRKSAHPYALRTAPNLYLLVLVGLTLLAWSMGGLSAGANGFVRTEWGLVVALLLGPLFQTEKQIDTFVRSIFYSSVLVLLILALYVTEGQYLGDLWRLGGQYGIPNTLAGVSFSLFAFGLYVLEQDRKPRGNLLTLFLLALLAIVIVLTQSQTVGGLMLVSVCLWLWAQKRRRLLYLVAVPSLVLLVGSSAASGWRLLSNFSLKAEDVNPSVLTLTGRTYLWTKTLEQYADANAFHKLVGLGWGNVFANFETFGFELSSVTENSFLWFLVGAGILGLIAFSGYLIWVLVRTWSAWRRASSEFERRLGLLAFVAALAFVIEGSTTDLVLSPVASGYLYAILSIFVFRCMSNRGNLGQAEAIGA
jgi:O-antigen ligase